MSLELPHGFSWDLNLRMGRETAALTARVWPNYLAEDSDIPERGLRFEIGREEFARRFPVWGIRRDDTGELVAFANAAQVAVDLSAQELPLEGWSFAIRSGGSRATPNCLCLLVANVDPTARGLGLSRVLIERGKQTARELGFDTMIAPVRPTSKSNFPFTPMTDYLMKHEDPWVSAHVKAGARVVNVCSESVRVRASLTKWRSWTGLPLVASGERVLPAGLVPLKSDAHRDIGIYCEPGVWVRYSILQ